MNQICVWQCNNIKTKTYQRAPLMAKKRYKTYRTYCGLLDYSSNDSHC